jgi:CRISPR-associated protein Cas5/DevS
MTGLYVTVPVACFRKGLAREYLETEMLPPPATCYGFLLSLVGETNRRKYIGARVAPVLLNKPPTSVVLRTVWRCKDFNTWTDNNGVHHHFASSDFIACRTWMRCVLTAQLLKNSSHSNVDEYFNGSSWKDDFDELKERLDWPSLTSEWINAKPEPFTPTDEKPKDFFKSHKELEKVLNDWIEKADQFVIGQGAGTNARPDYQQLLTDVQLVVWLDSPELEQRVSAALKEPSNVTRFGGLCLGESTHLVDEVSFIESAANRLPSTGRAFLIAPKGRLTLPVWVDHVGSAGTRYATGDLMEGPLNAPSLDQMPIISPE